MAMKAKLDSIDDLPAEIQEQYKQDGDVFILQVEGIKDHPEVLNLKTAHESQKEANRTLRNERDTFKQRLDGLPEDFDAHTYEALTAAAEGKGGQLTAEQKEELTTRIRTGLEKQFNATVAAKDADNEKLRGYLNRMTVDDGLSKAMDDAQIDPKHKSKLLPYLKATGKIVVEESEDGFRATVDTDMGPINLSKFVGDWASSEDGKIYVAQSTGPNPKGGKGLSGGKTVTRSQYDAMSFDDQRATIAGNTKIVD